MRDGEIEGPKNVTWHQTWEEIRPWLHQVMDSLQGLFEIFEGPEPAIGISILMLGCLALAELFLFYRIVPIWWTLRRLAKMVRQNNNTRQAFAAAYATVDQEMRQPRFLRHAWIEFTESLVVHERDPHHAIRNTARPELYLNVHAAEASGKSMRFLHALPNYFVGFGLLFTFIGLVAAIYFASQGVASRDVDAAQESLRNLLNAATFKFMTSIVGLGASIILSMSYRYLVQQLQWRFDRLCEALEKGMLFATHESIAFDGLLELKEHSEQLKRFNTDFAIEVGEVLRNRMSESLSEALKPLTQAVQSMAGNVGEMNQDALARMAKTFGDDLKGAAGSEMESLVQGLGEIRSSLDTVVERINETSSDFGDRIASSASRVEALLGAAGEQLREKTSTAAAAFANQLEGASDNLASSLMPLSEQIGRFEGSIDGLDVKLESQRQAFQDVAETVRNITGDVAQTIEDLRHAASPLASVSNQFESAAKEIRAAGEAITATHVGLKSLAATIGETADAMKSAWADYQSRFEEVDKGLAGAVEQLVTGADAYRQHVQSFVSGLDKELDRAVRQLSGGIDTLKDSIEELIELRENDNSPRIS